MLIHFALAYLYLHWLSFSFCWFFFRHDFFVVAFVLFFSSFLFGNGNPMGFYTLDGFASNWRDHKIIFIVLVSVCVCVSVGCRLSGHIVRRWWCVLDGDRERDTKQQQQRQQRAKWNVQQWNLLSRNVFFTYNMFVRFRKAAGAYDMRDAFMCLCALPWRV